MTFDSIDAKGYRELKDEKDLLQTETVRYDKSEKRLQKEQREISDMIELCERYQNEALPKTVAEAELMYYLKRFDYLWLKVNYRLIFADKDSTRKTLYKLDQLVRDDLNNDFRYRTEYISLAARHMCQHKNIQPAHYEAKNWLESLEMVDLQLTAVAKKKTKPPLSIFFNKKVLAGSMAGLEFQ